MSGISQNQGYGIASTQANQGYGIASTQANQGSGIASTQTNQDVGIASTKVNQVTASSEMKLPQSFNSSMIVFVSLYLVLWLFVSVLMFNLVTIRGCSMYMFILLNLCISISFLLCIFYSPWNHSLHKKINASKQKYDNLKKDTEQIYQHQIKVFWLNDLNQQTQYYLYAYMLLSFLPFFYFFAILLASTFTPIDYNKLHLFIVQFSLFYTGLQLLMYCIAKKQWWFILIPILLFLCMIATVFLNFSFDIVRTIVIVILSVLISISTLMVSSVYFLTIPLFLCGIIGVILRMTQ